MVDGLFYTFVFAASFLGVLGFLVFFHELGHYSVARLFKIRVERFSIGFGKPIFKRKAKSGTLWTISRIPLGGYVKFHGDAGAGSNPDTEALKKIKAAIDTEHGAEAWKECFHFKPLWQKFLVVLAGPMANFLLAVVIYMGIVLALGTSHSPAKISSFTAGNQVAKDAGLQIGDNIVAIDGKRAETFREVKQIVMLNSGEDLLITVNRGGERLDFTVTPKRTMQTDAIGGKISGGLIGVGFENQSYTKEYNVGSAAVFGVKTVKENLVSTGKYIGRIFQGKENGKALGGIVKIGAMTGKVGVDSVKIEGPATFKLKVLLVRLLELGAALSVGLGFANLLPIPVLDGGHLLFYSYEAVMRKPMSERMQEMGFRLGFAVLITLFLVLTWNDIGYVADLMGKTG